MAGRMQRYFCHGLLAAAQAPTQRRTGVEPGAREPAPLNSRVIVTALATITLAVAPLTAQRPHPLETSPPAGSGELHESELLTVGRGWSDRDSAANAYEAGLFTACGAVAVETSVNDSAAERGLADAGVLKAIAESRLRDAGIFTDKPGAFTLALSVEATEDAGGRAFSVQTSFSHDLRNSINENETTGVVWSRYSYGFAGKGTAERTNRNIRARFSDDLDAFIADYRRVNEGHCAPAAAAPSAAAPSTEPEPAAHPYEAIFATACSAVSVVTSVSDSAAEIALADAEAMKEIAERHLRDAGIFTDRPGPFTLSLSFEAAKDSGGNATNLLVTFDRPLRNPITGNETASMVSLWYAYGFAPEGKEEDVSRGYERLLPLFIESFVDYYLAGNEGYCE